MNKLEDKLTASIKKTVQQPKTAAAQTAESTAKAKTKVGTSAKQTKQKQAKQKQTKQKQVNSGTNQSVLHPQRIWPD